MSCHVDMNELVEHIAYATRHCFSGSEVVNGEHRETVAAILAAIATAPGVTVEWGVHDGREMERFDHPEYAESDAREVSQAEWKTLARRICLPWEACQ